MISEHLQNIKGLIIDMDGVLWHDTQPIGDLPAIF
ncbi:MAG: haloacid dehalogenase, partial [Chloroflexi bacterium]|nr:haloacid dehalogenase [Chloroflexota bacterium]